MAFELSAKQSAHGKCKRGIQCLRHLCVCVHKSERVPGMLQLSRMPHSRIRQRRIVWIHHFVIDFTRARDLSVCACVRECPKHVHACTHARTRRIIPIDQPVCLCAVSEPWLGAFYMCSGAAVLERRSWFTHGRTAAI